MKPILATTIILSAFLTINLGCSEQKIELGRDIGCPSPNNAQEEVVTAIVGATVTGKIKDIKNYISEEYLNSVGTDKLDGVVMATSDAIRNKGGVENCNVECPKQRSNSHYSYCRIVLKYKDKSKITEEVALILIDGKWLLNGVGPK